MRRIGLRKSSFYKKNYKETRLFYDNNVTIDKS